MNAMAISTPAHLDGRSGSETMLRRSEKRLSALSLVSAAALIGSVVTAIVLVAAAWTLASRSASLAATAAIAASFALLYLIAHCLDRIGEIDKAIRLEYCRRHGLSDVECDGSKLDQ